MGKSTINGYIIAKDLKTISVGSPSSQLSRAAASEGLAEQGRKIHAGYRIAASRTDHLVCACKSPKDEFIPDLQAISVLSG
jgi:hypothetical protein